MRERTCLRERSRNNNTAEDARVRCSTTAMWEGEGAVPREHGGE